MAMNSFAPFIKINGCFLVKNILPTERRKTIRIFNYPIPIGMERDLLAIPGVAESDIRASLLKGELQHKILAKEIEITCSDIDLLQFNENHKRFLKTAGIVKGLDIGTDQINPSITLPSGNDPYTHYEDVKLLGAVDNSNTVFTIPEGIFFYDSSHKIIIYKNGVKQAFLDDFFIAEAGGPGTGYTTVIMAQAPSPTPAPVDIITADYYVAR